MDEKITNIVVKKERSISKQRDGSVEKPPRKDPPKTKEFTKNRPQTAHKVISDKEAEEIRYPKKPKAPPVPSHIAVKMK